VLALLTQGAQTAGCATDRWILRRIRVLMLVEFGVDYHAHDLAHRLRTLGWSPQQLAVYAREGEDAFVHAWLTRDRPRIKKRKRRALSTVIALTLSGTMYKRHVGHAIGGAEIAVTLRHVQRHMPGPLIIIWDRVSAHWAAVVKAYLTPHPEITVEWLPPYALDLDSE
jgi:hypothetical protein